MMNRVDLTYSILCDEGKKRTMLYHYTSIDILRKILKSQSFVLTNLDDVNINDKEENDRIIGMNNGKIYVSCFTHDENETSYFWDEYTKHNISKGIRIGIRNNFFDLAKIKSFTQKDYYFEKYEKSELYKEYHRESDWRIRDVTLSDVGYVADLDDYTVVNKELKEIYGDCVNLSEDSFRQEILTGLVKRSCWEKESETRFRVAIAPKGLSNSLRYRSHPKPNFSKMLLEIPKKTLLNMEIVINPSPDKDFLEELETVVKEFSLKKPNKSGLIRKT